MQTLTLTPSNPLKRSLQLSNDENLPPGKRSCIHFPPDLKPCSVVILTAPTTLSLFASTTTKRSWSSLDEVSAPAADLLTPPPSPKRLRLDPESQPRGISHSTLPHTLEYPPSPPSIPSNLYSKPFNLFDEIPSETDSLDTSLPTTFKTDFVLSLLSDPIYHATPAQINLNDTRIIPDWESTTGFQLGQMIVRTVVLPAVSESNPATTDGDDVIMFDAITALAENDTMDEPPWRYF
ncbi:hypothetical protein HK097_003878 [Rhizophlyctis rosea]|uniref:Uncharacterized protein n=1 Tax=Rhizophlyctis rosea TaxID=64517 RepID=A0AAD5S3T6_9FUNG|nr:hypothetical protein HK097_003878 [Rhizophlyctis rosea]